MILIVTESFDRTADKVCTWLNYSGTSYIRFNTDTYPARITKIDFKDNAAVDIKVTYEAGLYDLIDFDVIWFRRGEFTIDIPIILNDICSTDFEINSKINKHLDEEANALLRFVYFALEKQSILVNCPTRYQINKLECLYQARKAGLKIPQTAVLNDERDLQMLARENLLVTKNIQDILRCVTDKVSIVQQTTRVPENVEEKSPKEFFPSLFQSLVLNSADIRAFFIGESVFAAAIIPYNDDVQIDYRGRGNFVDKNAIFPYHLPEDIKIKLVHLSRIMNVTCGSADFIRQPDGEHLFIEINPVGQIDFLSVCSNFQIEREIADYLNLQCNEEEINK